MSVILCIIDGFGICKDQQLTIKFIQKNLDKGVLLETSGQAVGLIDGQMGNSEVGHMTIGAGRIIKQNLTKISEAVIQNKLPEINGDIFHIIGLLSDGGVHSHIDHIIYLIKHLQHKEILLHIITDGRDVPPKSIEKYMAKLEPFLNDKCRVATISGRYYAMDRDNRSERTNKAFEAIALGKSDFKYSDDYVKEQYDQGITDEFFQPACNGNYKGMSQNDTVIFFNFRSDRMRQIVKKIHSEVKCKEIISMVDYFDGGLNDIRNLFTSDEIYNTLGEVIANAGKKQLRIAETEKYAHVTFFLNCGKEDSLHNEDRILVPSPKVATYDLKPEMSAYEITDKLIIAISSRKYDFICVNFANADMVGHTGDFEAGAKACLVLDECLSKIEESASENGYNLFITADHGNIEKMFDKKNNQPHTAHTLNKVPFIAIGCEISKIPNYKYGLQDVAPTILASLKIKIPPHMTGKSLIKK